MRREIEDNLLGIDPDSIAEIALIIWCGANYSQAGAELWITDVALRTKQKKWPAVNLEYFISQRSQSH
ncbi:MAG: hypothetical protein ABIF87_03645 [Pseudomonadota bacterium]